MQCPDCGNEVYPGELFCDNCGRDLSDLGQPTASAPVVGDEAQTPASSVAEQAPSNPDPASALASTSPEAAIPPPATGQPSPPPETATETAAAVAPIVDTAASDAGQTNAVDVAAPQAETPPLPSPAPTTGGARLVVADGGAAFELAPGQEITIGRVDPIEGIYPDIDLTPHDPATGVSREHAVVHAQGGQWFLKDLASTNYTIVNRQKLTPHQDYLLQDGDEIRFGRVVVNFQMAG